MFTTRTTSTIILVCLLLFGLLTGFCESQGPPGTPLNIRISGITSTSFVVQWDEVDDAKLYCVQWRDDGSSVRSRESNPSRTSITIKQLSPNTIYNVTVTVGTCRSGTVSDFLIVTTNVTILVGPLSSLLTMATPTSSSSVITTTPMLDGPIKHPGCVADYDYKLLL
ncbi:receptor-type tyrosine-protein phosphatase H-like isoform X2 [Dysidea avara]|uniref:receptor-type tyrosine-protein phosphatase H-like isoform X2 n=1 Tax=Dysidea avara TaxID=196820 RepID=UPI0033329418